MAAIEMKTNPSQPSTEGLQALTPAQMKALQPLENTIGYLGVARDGLEGLRDRYSNGRRHHTNDFMKGPLHDTFFKRGTEKHHRALAKDIRSTNRFTHAIQTEVPLVDIADTHEAIANRIGKVKAAHAALSASHPKLAWKDGSMGRKNRKYKTPSGATQSLGEYHGKNITDDGTPKTFGKGGRKRTRKTRRRKRKTRRRKRKTRRRKRKRKTRKRRKHRR
jgi:hypothetical protein